VQGARNWSRMVETLRSVDPGNSELGKHYVNLLNAVYVSPNEVFTSLAPLDSKQSMLTLLEGIAFNQCSRLKDDSALHAALYRVRQRRLEMAPNLSSQLGALNKVTQSAVATHDWDSVPKMVTRADELRTRKAPPDLDIANVYKLAFDVLRVKERDNKETLRCAKLAYVYADGSHHVNAQVVTRTGLADAYRMAGNTRKASELASITAAEAKAFLHKNGAEKRDLTESSCAYRAALWSRLCVYVKERNYDKVLEQIDEDVRLEHFINPHATVIRQWRDAALALRHKDWNKLDAMVQKGDAHGAKFILGRYTPYAGAKE